MRLPLLLLLSSLLLFGCRAENTSSAEIQISLEIAGESPIVGDASRILVTLSDSAGNPINDAVVNLRGDMSHAGMSPVLGESNLATNGVYEIPFEFSMGGDWVLTVDVSLADGSTASRSFEVDGVGSSSNAPSSAGTAVSAAYFSITNDSANDLRLMSVTAEGIGETSIHQTIVENNIARMVEVEGGFLIAAGTTAELAPSGYHVMLVNIAIPLIEGESIALNLTFDNDVTLTVDAVITNIAPDAGGSAEAAGLAVTGAWVRPTALGN